MISNFSTSMICSTYRKGKDLCTTHSIKNVVLHEIVLRNLREAISYVSEHEAEFIQDAAESDMPVSYTHLDVYKRQHENRAGVKLPWSCASSRLFCHFLL